MPFAPSRRRFQRRLALAVAVLLTLAVPAAVAVKPIPLDWKHMVGDPSVLKTSKKYVVIATGAKVNRGLSKNGKVWKWKGSALASLPSWARSGDIWAADLAKVGSRYLLYFAAPVRGKTASSRCIGVATATRVKGDFVPIAGPPLACPTWSGLGASDRVLDTAAVQQYNADVRDYRRVKQECKAAASPTPTPSPTPTDPSDPTDPGTDPASDPTDPTSTPPTVRPTDPNCDLTEPSKPQTASNVIGAIDPSLFIDGNGQPYLLYKTDGIPSSVRILPLSADGLHPAAVTDQTAPQAASRAIASYTGVLENPVMLKRNGRYYLFDSQGDYARCSYRTVWRASTSLTDWSHSLTHTLLTRKNTHKLCGPGGADVLEKGHKVLMYFEAWTCKHSYKPCGKNFWSYSRKYQRKHPMRALYAGKLGFHGGAPYLKKYLKGSKH